MAGRTPGRECRKTAGAFRHPSSLPDSARCILILNGAIDRPTTSESGLRRRIIGATPWTAVMISMTSRKEEDALRPRKARGVAGQRDQMSLCSPLSPWVRVA